MKKTHRDAILKNRLHQLWRHRNKDDDFWNEATRVAHAFCLFLSISLRPWYLYIRNHERYIFVDRIVSRIFDKKQVRHTLNRDLNLLHVARCWASIIVKNNQGIGSNHDRKIKDTFVSFRTRTASHFHFSSPRRGELLPSVMCFVALIKFIIWEFSCHKVPASFCGGRTSHGNDQPLLQANIFDDNLPRHRRLSIGRPWEYEIYLGTRTERLGRV